MVLRVSGRWSDPSLPVAGPAHSAWVPGSLPAQFYFAASAGKRRGCSQGSVRKTAGRQPRRAAVQRAPFGGARARECGALLAPSAASQPPTSSCRHPTFAPVAAPPGSMSKAAAATAAAATWGRAAAAAAAAGARGQ